MSTPQTEFDFWEFVTCSKCQLSFLSGPDTVGNVPFWLTECGHIMCNNHISPSSVFLVFPPNVQMTLESDQSCAQCGAKGVEFLPLQREPDPPMSEWFRSVPHMLDSVTYAAKFQQEAMATQIRTLKVRHQQQRLYIDKLKRQIAELQRMNESLQHQLHPSYAHEGSMEYGGEPSTFVNANGKRSIGSSMKDDRSPTTSSPRRMSTPIGMNRLTLPPGQRPPHLSSKPPDIQDLIDTDIVQGRPGSRHFIQCVVHLSPGGGQTNLHTREYSYDPTPKQVFALRNYPISRSGKVVKPINVSSNQRKHNSQLMPPPPTPHGVQVPQRPVRNLPMSVHLPSSGSNIPRQAVPSVPSNFASRPSPILSLNQLPESSSRVPSRSNPMLTGGGQRTPFIPK
ncbi:hypothetical protein L218DRAFT_997428 [Marasmius fiardii PR-910]|nr:hypothetical protein L218DRAFT_997428 [Marasmius fiardii PR-910]